MVLNELNKYGCFTEAENLIVFKDILWWIILQIKYIIWA